MLLVPREEEGLCVGDEGGWGWKGKEESERERERERGERQRRGKKGQEESQGRRGVTWVGVRAPVSTEVVDIKDLTRVVIVRAGRRALSLSLLAALMRRLGGFWLLRRRF